MAIRPVGLADVGHDTCTAEQANEAGTVSVTLGGCADDVRNQRPGTGRHERGSHGAVDHGAVITPQAIVGIVGSTRINIAVTPSLLRAVPFVCTEQICGFSPH